MEPTRGPWYRQLHWQIFLAMALGIVAGRVGGEAFADRVAWLGTVFVRLLKLIIVPLVVTSLVTGIASVGSAGLGRLFRKTLGFYVLSSLLAAIGGLIFVNLIRPGVGANITGTVHNIYTLRGALVQAAGRAPPHGVTDLVQRGPARVSLVRHRAPPPDPSVTPRRHSRPAP